jgi:hypothetical protein
LELQLAIASCKAAFEVLKLGVDARDDAKIKDATFEIQQKLLDVSTASIDLAGRLSKSETTCRNLERENAELQAKIKEKASYVLYELKPGCFCYKFKPDTSSIEPQHYLCQSCFDKGTKSVLQKKTACSE